MAAEGLKFRCDGCGVVAAGPLALVAKAGGAHYQQHTRVSGIGQKPFTRATRCGTWVAADDVQATAQRT